QVHAVRIGLRVEGERRRCGGWTRDRIATLKRPLEVTGNQRSRFLRAHVVGIVVTARKRVRSNQDAALYLRPEARSPRRFVHRTDVLALDAQTVANAVESREVRGALGGSNEVIRRDAIV